MGYTILYVEDNFANYRLVERVLKAEGYRLLHARDGLEALQLAKAEQENLDLILMDINLPEIDGYEATARLKSIPGFEAIPILAVTVNSLSADRCRSLAAGCDGFIRKPIDVSTFADDVRSYLKGKKEKLPVQDENEYLREHNKRFLERLENSMTELQTARESKNQNDRLANIGEMAAGIMHELRNPLSAVSVLAEYLLAKGNDDEKLQEYLERILENVSRMKALSEGVKNFARPIGEKKGCENLALALEDTINLASHELKQYGVAVVKEIPKDLPAVMAAEGQLIHLFLNLIRNGAQSVSMRMEQDLSSGQMREDHSIKIRVHAGETGDCVITEIADTGIGIPPELKDRIFDPFFTTKPRGEGTGLGLHISKQIIDDLGASIEVDSQPNCGATFIIKLPVATSSERMVG